MAVRPKMTPPTQGDQSNAAATGKQDRLVAVATDVKTVTPAGWRPDTPEGAGDLLFGTVVSEMLSGGIEYTVLPTEDPNDAYRVYKLSPQLGPIIDALVANVYAAGFTLKPVIDPDRPNAAQKVTEALKFLYASKAGSFEVAIEIPSEELDRELTRIRTRIANETQFLRSWFARACPGTTYRRVATLVGQDMEIQGDGYVEVLRDANGYPAKLIWAPAWSIRAKPIEEEFTPTVEPVAVTDLHWSTEVNHRRFRSYVQVDLQGTVVARYKEYGDKRCMSRRTGRYYKDLDEMYKNLEEEWYTDADNQVYPPQPATELLSFSLPSPISCTYGKPTYTGIFPCLDGARDLEEENRTLITDRKVPQMFILVAGGAGIPNTEIKALEERISQNNKEGKKSIYILQARSARNATGTISPTPSIEIVKTKSEQYQDALGLKYLEHAEQQARHAYRLPRVALGQHDSLTADEAPEGYRYAEAQVYDPRRNIVDDRMNSTIIRDLGCQLVRYETLSRTPKEPNELADIINKLMVAGVLTPDEGRELASDIFNKEFKDLEGIWSKLPTKLLVAMLQTKNQLVAAALLGSESESDIIARLQAALVAQLQAAPPAGTFNPAAANNNPLLGTGSSDEQRTGEGSNPPAGVDGQSPSVSRPGESGSV